MTSASDTSDEERGAAATTRKKSRARVIIEARLATARAELDAAGEYDARVVNDDVDRVVAEIRALIDARLAEGDN